MPLYTPTGPIAKTLDYVATVLSGLAAVHAFCRADSAAAALQRIMPGDGGFLVGKACGWDGTIVKAEPPAIIMEAKEPEYTNVSGANTWRVTEQVDLFLVHPRVKTDHAAAAYLRAWDDHNLIQLDLMRLPKSILDAQLVGTSQAPAVFGTAAPPVLQEHYLSTISIRYTKGQPT